MFTGTRNKAWRRRSPRATRRPHVERIPGHPNRGNRVTAQVDSRPSRAPITSGAVTTGVRPVHWAATRLTRWIDRTASVPIVVRTVHCAALSQETPLPHRGLCGPLSPTAFSTLSSYEIFMKRPRARLIPICHQLESNGGGAQTCCAPPRRADGLCRKRSLRWRVRAGRPSLPSVAADFAVAARFQPRGKFVGEGRAAQLRDQPR